VTVILLFVPSSETVKPLVIQSGVLKSEFCCNVKSLEDDGQEMVTVFPECVMVNAGAPAVCTTEIKLQNPPVKEKLPPLIAPPASA